MAVKFFLQGSAVLKKLFCGAGYEADDRALILSPFSLVSGRQGEYTACNESPKAALDINKDFEAYIQQSDADFAVIDLYTAASLSCYKLGASLFTACTAFEKSNFYKTHRDEFERLSPPFDKTPRQGSLDKYAKILLSRFSSDRIIFIRLQFSERKAKHEQLRNGRQYSTLNRRIREIEDYLIPLLNPVVIDIAGDFFLSGEDSSPSSFEPYFFENVRLILNRIIGGEKKKIYDTPDIDLWLWRILKYYDSMSARAFYSWLLDDKRYAADRLIRYTSKGFIESNAAALKRLKLSEISDLSEVEVFFDGDLCGRQVVLAARAISALLKNDLSKPDEVYSVIFKIGGNALSLLAKVLAAKFGKQVGAHNAEEVFYLRNDSIALSQYFDTHAPVFVDIWGSCISRESVNPALQNVCVQNYIFKQPCVLAFEPPVPQAVPTDLAMFDGSSWRRKTVSAAFSRNGAEIVKMSRCEWLIVDFYDLICKMRSLDGHLFEADEFLIRMPFYVKMANKCREAYIFSDMAEDALNNAFKRFAEFAVNKYGKNIILIKAQPKSEYVTLDGTLASLADPDGLLPRKREFIARYEELFASLTDCAVIDISKYFYSDDSFPLGGAHIVHYEKAFYEECCKCICEILGGSSKRLYDTVSPDLVYKRNLKLNRS